MSAESIRNNANAQRPTPETQRSAKGEPSTGNSSEGVSFDKLQRDTTQAAQEIKRPGSGKIAKNPLLNRIFRSRPSGSTHQPNENPSPDHVSIPEPAESSQRQADGQDLSETHPPQIHEKPETHPSGQTTVSHEIKEPEIRQAETTVTPTDTENENTHHESQTTPDDLPSTSDRQAAERTNIPEKFVPTERADVEYYDPEPPLPDKKSAEVTMVDGIRIAPKNPSAETETGTTPEDNPTDTTESEEQTNPHLQEKTIFITDSPVSETDLPGKAERSQTPEPHQASPRYTGQPSEASSQSEPIEQHTHHPTGDEKRITDNTAGSEKYTERSVPPAESPSTRTPRKDTNPNIPRWASAKRRTGMTIKIIGKAAAVSAAVTSKGIYEAVRPRIEVLAPVKLKGGKYRVAVTSRHRWIFKYVVVKASSPEEAMQIVKGQKIRNYLRV